LLSIAKLNTRESIFKVSFLLWVAMLT